MADCLLSRHLRPTSRADQEARRSSALQMVEGVSAAALNLGRRSLVGREDHVADARGRFDMRITILSARPFLSTFMNSTESDLS